MKANKNITKIEKDLFEKGYTVSEYYKNYGIAFYTSYGYMFYAITSGSRVLYDTFNTKQGAKMFITKMIRKGIL